MTKPKVNIADSLLRLFMRDSEIYNSAIISVFSPEGLDKNIKTLNTELKYTANFYGRQTST